MARTNQIQVRRGTATQWSNTNPVLASGEPGFDTTNSLLKVGDGTSTWSSLSSNVGVGDAGLLSIAGLTTASGSYLYATANDVYTTGVITAFGRSLVDDADASTSRTTLGLAIGTNVQAYDAGLTSIASLTTASGSYLFATANDVYTTGISTVYGRSVLAASGVESLVTTTLTAGTGIALSYNSGTDTVTINTTYSTSRGSETVTSNKSAFTVAAEYVSGNLDVYYNGLKFLRNDDFTETSSTVFTLANPAVSGDVVEWVGLVGPATYQISDAGLTSIASLTTASGSYLYATANDVYTTGVITAFGRSLVDDADASTSRTTLGLAIGTNVQAYNSVLASTFAGGRLTLESGVAISTADQTAKTTLYYTPYSHSSIGLYDTTNSVWTPYNFTQTSLALGTLSSGVNYDTFMYSNSGTLTLASSSWASNTARTTAISLQDGVYVKTSDKSYRYLGTFRTTTTTTTEDSEAKRFVYNVNNQVPRHSLGVLGYVNNNAAVTFTLSSLNTWVALNGGVGNKCEWVNGLTSTCMLVGEGFAVAGAAGYVIIGIGIDSTTNGDFIVLQSDNTATATFGRGASKAYAFTLGYHYISLNGYTTGGTATIYKEDTRNGGTVDPIRTWIAAQQNM